jgi:hypothetical protein
MMSSLTALAWKDIDSVVANWRELLCPSVTTLLTVNLQRTRVKVIPARFLHDTVLQTVALPGSLTEIGRDFGKKAEIHDSVTFAGDSLGVLMIHENFLEEASMPEGSVVRLPMTVVRVANNFCRATKGLAAVDLKDCCNVTRIANSFAARETVTLPSGQGNEENLTIGNDFCRETQLQKLQIPASVKAIGLESFCLECPIKCIAAIHSPDVYVDFAKQLTKLSTGVDAVVHLCSLFADFDMRVVLTRFLLDTKHAKMPRGMLRQCWRKHQGTR